MWGQQLAESNSIKNHQAKTSKKCLHQCVCLLRGYHDLVMIDNKSSRHGGISIWG